MMDRVPIKTDPRLFDVTAAQVQRALASGCPWLDHVFGLCERTTDMKENKRFNSANLYIGNQQYAQIMPCDELGNFSFMYLRDPQTLGRRDTKLVTSPFSLIVWYNMEKMSFPYDERNREAVKAQVLAILEQAHFGWMTLGRIYERPENVFSDFSYDYVNNQFLMSPYAGFRIDGEMSVRVPCWQGDFNNDFNNDYSNQ